MAESGRPKAVPDVLVDNERVVVTKWSFADGAETGWHRHGHDYVVVPLGVPLAIRSVPPEPSVAALLWAFWPRGTVWAAL